MNGILQTTNRYGYACGTAIVVLWHLPQKTAKADAVTVSNDVEDVGGLLVPFLLPFPISMTLTLDGDMETEQRFDYHHLKSTLLIVLSLYVLYRISGSLYKAYRIRSRWHDIPSLPRHPIWGNIVNAGKRLDPTLNRHPDYGFEEIWRELGEPGCFLLDVAPFHNRGILIVAEPQHAEVIVNPSEDFKFSLPKDARISKSLKPLMGAEGIAAQNGARWRATRKRFGPGFQPQYVHSLTELILAKVNVFVDRLRALENSGATFRMADYARDLTFDVITQMAIAKDLAAQSTPEGQGSKSPLGLITISRRLSELVYGKGSLLGLDMLDPIRPIKLLFYEYIYDYKLTAIVKECIDSLASSSKSRSIIQLAACDVPHTKALVRTCMHQVKSFIFAGQDSTATLISWLCYEMSKASHNPHHAAYLKRLREEHTTVFGPGAFSALHALSPLSTPESEESLIASKLPYTTAFIKETLRLHPPAATGRAVPETAPSMSLSLPTHSISITGLQIYVNHYLIQRNPNIWGPDAHMFNPERWLDAEYVAKLPAGAYRPFERGPRNCIGQELAMLEALVVVSAVARGFAFEKVGLVGGVGAGGVVEREVWSTHAVTSVPVDGMVMRVRVAET